MEMPCWKPTETSVIEFWYKNVNLSLEELKNIKITLFLCFVPQHCFFACPCDLSLGRETKSDIFRECFDNSGNAIKEDAL